MAKIKGILSQTSGKVEGLGVVYESGGQTIARKSQQEFSKQNATALRDRAAEVQNSGQSLYDLYQFNPVGSAKFTPAAIILSRGGAEPPFYFVGRRFGVVFMSRIQ